MALNVCKKDQHCQKHPLRHTDQEGKQVSAYLELHQVDVYVPVVTVLAHGVCELCDSVASRSQPLLNLW